LQNQLYEETQIQVESASIFRLDVADTYPTGQTEDVGVVEPCGQKKPDAHAPEHCGFEYPKVRPYRPALQFWQRLVPASAYWPGGHDVNMAADHVRNMFTDQETLAGASARAMQTWSMVELIQKGVQTIGMLTLAADGPVQDEHVMDAVIQIWVLLNVVSEM
jgi:hypothetical protein